jgi:hypothetical protein
VRRTAWALGCEAMMAAIPERVADTPEVAPSLPRGPVARPHRLEFRRVGGLDQVVLASGADLLALEHLDPKLWIAVSCPTKGLELDARTLALLDTDGDRRVRVPEVLDAIRFCAARLRDLGPLLFGPDRVVLSSLREDTPEGRAALGAARHLVAQLGKPVADAIAAADVADTTRVFENTLLNGDGVVPPEAALDVPIRELILDVMRTVGATPDRSGKPGVDRRCVERFFAEATEYAQWWRRGDVPEIRVRGDRTEAAYAALEAVRAKVGDYFVRCGLAAMEPRAAAAVNRSDAEFQALAAKELAAGAGDVRAFPIARAEAGRPLPLRTGVNPAWTTAVAALRAEVVAPLLGDDKRELTHEEWIALVARFAAYEAWLGEKEGAAVEPLGIARVRTILAGPGREALEALIGRDEAFAAEAKAIDDVVRLVHYHRDLGTLLRNFVSFDDFYDPARAAVFQAGTLFLDARSCDLCIRIDDSGAHAAIGALSRMYLAYCDCRRPGGEAMKIVACFTQGDSDYLMVGRNGVFYDRRGRDWDATIVKIVENPISLRQAFWAPYKKALRFVEEQVARFAAAKDKEADQHLSAAAVHAGEVVAKPAAATAPSPVDVGKMVGVIAALGVGIGALGTLLGGFVSGFMELRPWWAKAVAVAAVVLVISGPSMLIAWLKLRHRTLGPILDANGWAVNGRVRINIPLAATLTSRATLPRGSRRVLEDPYADRAARRRRRALWLGLAIAAAVALATARLLGRWPFGPLSLR